LAKRYTSEVPDNAIIYGKLLTYTIYSLFFILILTLLNFIAIVIFIKTGITDFSLHGFPLKNFLLIFFICFSGSFISSEIGVYFSLRAKNWDQAQSYLRVGIIVISIPIILIYNIIEELNKYMKGPSESWFFVMTTIALFLSISLVFLILIDKKFKRSELIQNS
jgi:hypothetical protein